MATQAGLTDTKKQTAATSDHLDKSGWSGLQHLQYMLKLWDGVPGHPVKTRELPEWTWVPNEEWRSLQGFLSDPTEHSTTEMKARDRAFEEEHDARKFSRSS